MVLALQDKLILVFHKEWFKLRVPSQCWEKMIENINIFLWQGMHIKRRYAYKKKKGNVQSYTGGPWGNVDTAVLSFLVSSYLHIEAKTKRPFSNPFSCLKLIVLLFKFHWNLIPRVQSIMIQDWFRSWVGAAWDKSLFESILGKFNSSPPGQNGRHFGRRHTQTHFLQWKCMNFA